MLLLTILSYYKLLHLKLFLSIFNDYNIWLLIVVLLMAMGTYPIGGYLSQPHF